MTTTANLNLTLPDFNVSGWHDDVNGNFQLIDAAVDALDLQGAWNNSTAYSTGDRTVDVTTSRVYYCLVGHTSAATGTFAADRTANPTYWQIIPALQQFLQLTDVTDSAYTGKSNQVPHVNTAETALTLTPVAGLVFNQLGGNLDTNSFHIDFDDAHGIRDDSGNELIMFSKVASAVNYLDVSNAAAAGDVIILATGSDTNVDVDIQTKGSGDVLKNGNSIADLGTENQTCAGGVTVTEKNLGTVSSGTLTLDVGDRPQQYYTNGGAHTLAPGSTVGSTIVTITNNGTAGAITTSGFTQVTGDAFDTTNTNKFICNVVVSQSISLLQVTAMQ